MENGSNVVAKKIRDPYFDNFKGFLILCVIFCHMAHDVADTSVEFKYIYTYVLSFVMPAFVFMSGYFSGSVEKCRKNAVQNFLVPYIFFDILEGVLQYFVIDPGVPFHEWFTITTPYWAMWYLFAMFVWRLLAPDIKKIRFAVPVTAIIGLGVGFFPDFAAKMSLGRITSLLFFFTLGLFFKKEWIEKIREKNTFFAITALALMFVLVPVLIHTKVEGVQFLTRGALLARKPYPDALTTVAMFRRVYYYIIGTIMTVTIMVIVPRKECFLTKMGKNSISVYVFHIFVLFYLKANDFFDRGVFFGLRGLILIIALDFILTFILSRDFVRKIYDSIVNVLNKIIFKDDVQAGLAQKG